MQDNGASQNKADDLTLDDWMAQIREKKLRKIVPNGHKQGAPATAVPGKEGPGEPQLLNEIQRMRQGLRSVSAATATAAGARPEAISRTSRTPAEATPAFIAPKLRSVSSPTRSMDRPSSVASSAQPDKSASAAVQDAVVVKSPEISAEQASAAEPAPPTKEDSAGDDAPSPLDAEKVDGGKTAGAADDVPIAPSSGIVATTDDKVELVLPSAKNPPADDDDFPLDLELAKQDEIDAVKEEPPFTPSSGVFSASDIPVELTLPGAKNVPKDDDFPLDAETPAAAATFSTDQEQAAEELAAPSAGVSATETQPIRLTLPTGKTSRIASLATDKASVTAKSEQKELQVEAKPSSTSPVGETPGNAATSPGKHLMNSKQRTELSRALSRMLRHNAANEGLAVRSDGYISVAAILARPKLKKYQATQAKIEEVVALDNKSRYAMQQIDGVLFIRANQGHSIQVDDLELEKIQDDARFPVVLHGTNEAALKLILDSGGLSKMKRNHIHLATGKFGDAGVTSGVRKDCTVFIYVDMAKAMADGILFYKSANGVILTAGVDGILAEKYFSKIEQSEDKSTTEAEPSKKDF